MARRVRLYAETIRHMTLAQLASRVKLRTQRAVVSRFPGPTTSLMRRAVESDSLPGWPKEFKPLGRSTSRDLQQAETDIRDRLELIHVDRALGDPPDWSAKDASQLWRYHLHYWEWAWSLLGRSDAEKRFEELWRSWCASCPMPGGDPWHPYVVSLRGWVLCDLFDQLVKGTSLEREFLDDLVLHAGYVRTHLERDVGGNHLLKNIKAVVGFGIFFGDEDLVRFGLRALAEQLDVQVLSDGGHYERSPSYHVQVLEDLLDIAGLLRAAGEPGPSELIDRIEVMRRWLSLMRLPDGGVPLLNDCTRVGRRRLEAVGDVEGPAPEGLALLPESGYFVASRNKFHLVGDVGVPCPDELPAHAQADCLSFVLSVDGERVIVDTGVSTYAGMRRGYERSTRAHNTVEIDGEDQTEVWGQFRAARRARPTIEEARDTEEAVVVQACHDGYQRLAGKPTHRRRWELTDDRLTITDDATGAQRLPLRSYLHLAPGITPELMSGDRVRAGPVEIAATVSGRSYSVQIVPAGEADLGWVAEDFNVLHPSAVLVVGGEIRGRYEWVLTLSRERERTR